MAAMVLQEEICSAAEAEARRDLAAAFRLAAHYGWDDLVFGHMSVRHPDAGERFLFNRFDQLFEEVTASSLVNVDANGEPQDTGRTENDGPRVNRAGFVIHSAIMKARPDVNAVIHLHTCAGEAVSAIGDGLLPLNQNSMMIGADLAYHDYEGIALDLDERGRIVADLGDKNIMILRHHGTLTMGRTMGEAFLRMYVLERACRTQLSVLAAGLDRILPVPADIIDTVKNQARPDQVGVAADELAWPALLRKASRIAPDFSQ